MSYDDYKLATPDSYFDEDNDNLEQCHCCGEMVSPYALNEATPDFWICNKCYTEWDETTH